MEEKRGQREQAVFLGARHSEATSDIPAHAHNFYELNFMTRGNTRMKVNEKVIEYDSYDFLLIPPKIRHILYESNYDQFDNYVIWFEWKDHQLLLDNQIIKLHDYNGVVQFLCREIYQTHMKTILADAEILNIYLEAVLWHMKKGLVLGTGQAVRDDEDMVDEAIKYINVNIMNARVSVALLSRNLNVSEEHFSRMFKKKNGITPIKYINEVKIAEARRLLLKTNATVKEISEMLYYSDQFYFSTQFKKFTGYSPSEYRCNGISVY